MPRVPSRFMRQIRFALVILIGCAASTGVSFTLVRYLLRDYSMVDLPAPETVLKAQALRRAANQLAETCSEYAERLPPETAAPLPDDLAWIRQHFLPIVRELRRELVDLEPGEPGAAANVRDTVDRAIGMATYPGDVVLRARVLEAAGAAIRLIELWISTTNVPASRLEPPAKADF